MAHLDVTKISGNGKGEYWFRDGTAACWLRFDDGRSLLVVSAVACSVAVSAGFFDELNYCNMFARSAKVVYEAETVFVEAYVHLEGLSALTFTDACNSVGTVANIVGAGLVAKFGGRTPFPPRGSDVGSADRGSVAS
jgi:hypothetical protein